MSNNDTPTLSTIRKSRGVAGQFSASVTVTYSGEEPSELTFVGNTLGGPVVMVTPSGQNFVSQSVTDRIGCRFETDPQRWVRGFFRMDEEAIG